MQLADLGAARQQDTQRQVDELVRAGVNAVDILGDKASGSTMDRPGWEACLKSLEPGDIPVVHSLERLSRNTLDTLQTFRDLADGGVKVRGSTWIWTPARRSVGSP